MSQSPRPTAQSEAHPLDVAADQAIAVCGGDVRDALKAMIVANRLLEEEVKELQIAVSNGYARGKYLEIVPSDRKDWYD